MLKNSLRFLSGRVGGAAARTIQLDGRRVVSAWFHAQTSHMGRACVNPRLQPPLCHFLLQ